MAITPEAPPPPGPPAWPSTRSVAGLGTAADWFFKQICQSSAVIILLMVALIVALLSIQAWPAMRQLGTEVFTAKSWDPNPRYDEAEENVVSNGSFAVLPFIYGSVVTSLIAMLIAVPLGVGTAAFLSEIAGPSVKRGGSFLVELLAAIPSVVYGFWGVNFLAPWVQDVFTLMGGPNTAGKGLLSSGLILAIMVVPYVAAVSYDVLQAVPGAQRQGSLALGATRWQTVSRVVIPYGLPGITGGCFLALGRALGETMAVTMLIGNTPLIEHLPYGRGYSIPSVLAQELSNANSSLHFSVLIEMGLMLFAVTILMNVLARLLIWQVGRPGGGFNVWRPMMRLIVGPAKPVLAPTAEMRSAATRGPRGPLGTPLVNPLLVNKVMTGVLGLCLVVTCIPLFLILGYILYRGVGALDLNFFMSLPKPMGEAGGGLANAIVGSGVIVGLAAVISLPVGLFAAIYLAEYRTNRIGPVVRFFGELLNGVPSIVVGTFVYAFVQLLVYWHWLSPKSQFSGWAGVFALTIMMVPIVMRASEESLKLVPQTLRNASHALGAYHWQTVLRVSVPAALPAIITGAFLAIARIAGETAPLLMTAFGNEKMALNPEDKMGFLPLYIFRYSMSGNEIWEKQAWAAALVLLTFVMLLNIGVRFLTGKRVVLASRAD